MIMDVKKETSSELKNISKTNILQYLSCSSPSAAPLPHCSRTADVVIHCSDGRLAGHRLVLASISGMLHEELLCNSADDLTSVMMPDFTLDQVSSYLHHVYACQDVEKFQDINASFGYQKFRHKFIAKRNKPERNDSEYSTVFTKNEVEVKLECDYDYEDLDAYSGEDNNKWDRSDGDDSDDGDPVFQPRVKKEPKTVKEKEPRKTKTKVKRPRKTNPKKENTSNPLFDHFTQDLENKRWMCCYCEKSFSLTPEAPQSSHQSLKTHLLLNHPEKDKDIPESAAILTTVRKNPTKSFVWDHFTKNKETGLCECHHCGKHISATNGNTTSMRTHMISSHPHEIKAKEATQSAHTVKTPEGKLIRTGLHRRLKCDVCVFETRSSKFLDRHMFEKHEQTMCSFCGMNFSKFGLYYTHSLTHKDPEVCSECGQEFKTPRLLKLHTTHAHANLPREICPYCGKDFLAVSLKGHIDRIHEKKFKPHPCQHCDYIAKNKSELEGHIERRHGESNPVNCPWCGKFVKCLETHLKRKNCNIPESERETLPTLQCPICPKTFQVQRALRKHIRTIHEQPKQVKNYQCHQCNYKTFNKSNLYAHVKTEHLGRPLKEQCPHCRQIVINMEWHIRTYHGQAAPPIC